MGVLVFLSSTRLSHQSPQLSFIMKTTLALILVGCMVAVAMGQYVPEVPYYGDINNDGIPNAYDLNYDGKVDAGVYAHHAYPYVHGVYGAYPYGVYPYALGAVYKAPAAPVKAADAAPAEE